MREEKTTADRLAAYLDAVFAVIVTVMVLEHRAPDQCQPEPPRVRPREDTLQPLYFGDALLDIQAVVSTI